LCRARGCFARASGTSESPQLRRSVDRVQRLLDAFGGLMPERPLRRGAPVCRTGSILAKLACALTRARALRRLTSFVRLS
jgi:hypothetical protein